MTEIGDVYTTLVSLTVGSFTTVFAPTGETIKVTQCFPKLATNDGKFESNGDLLIAPASGNEADQRQGAGGYRTSPALGGNASNGSSNYQGIQPVFMTDSDGLYIGNNSASDLEIVVQGVRIA